MLDGYNSSFVGLMDEVHFHWLQARNRNKELTCPDTAHCVRVLVDQLALFENGGCNVGSLVVTQRDLVN